jgi:outer membrane protein TolC
MQPMMRANRQAQVAVFVAHLWLDAYRSHKSIDLIENDRNLFEYLVDVAQSSYTSATGQTRQQDLIRAQLELTRLDDRLTILKQQRDKNLADLGEWLEDFNVSLSANDANYAHVYSEVERHLLSHNGTYDANTLTEVLIIHPLIRSIDQKILASDSDIRIAKQSYKPQWGVNASYAYRDNTPEGEHRPDFLSLGVSFDVPLFTANRQDKRVQSAKAKFQSTKTERDLALRQLKAAYQSSVLNYHRLKERQALFDTRLLVEMYQQAEASLMAYTNDDGDFAEAVRAQIAQLNARIDALNIDIDIHKTLAQLNYFHADSREYSLLTHQPKH